MKWEIALQGDTSSRKVLAEDVDTDDVWAYFMEAAQEVGGPYHELDRLQPDEKRALARLKDKLGAVPSKGNYYGPRVPGILITRMDHTPEAKFAKWEADFYDVDRRGYKRRRFKKPQIEKDWEAMVKGERKVERDQRANNKAQAAGSCDECGARWSTAAHARGLVHICGEGLV